jgi:hypothetical protein
MRGPSAAFLQSCRFCLVLMVGSLLSSKPSPCQTVPMMKHAQSSDETYQAVLNELKKQGLSIESASVDTGIKTALVVSGRYRQTGTHTEIQFTKDSDSSTTVRVSVLEQTRYKALKTEPWSDPKVNTEASEGLIARLKERLGWKE